MVAYVLFWSESLNLLSEVKVNEFEDFFGVEKSATVGAVRHFHESAIQQILGIICHVRFDVTFDFSYPIHHENFSNLHHASL